MMAWMAAWVAGGVMGLAGPPVQGAELQLGEVEMKLPVSEAIQGRAVQKLEEGRAREEAEEARARESDLVSELLRRSEQNREKNRVAVRDKYWARELDGTYGGPFAPRYDDAAAPELNVGEMDGEGGDLGEEAAAIQDEEGPSSMDLLLEGYVED